MKYSLIAQNGFVFHDDQKILRRDSDDNSKFEMSLKRLDRHGLKGDIDSNAISSMRENSSFD